MVKFLAGCDLCGWAKANVLQSVGFVRWVAALLILQKRWHFVFHFSVRLLSVVSSFRVRHNVLQLPEGGDFGALHCQPSRNFDRSTKLDLTTEPPLLGRCCYAFALLFLCFYFAYFSLLFLRSRTTLKLLKKSKPIIPSVPPSINVI